jgi:uncharacterized protein YneF (UPF0154 family)
MDPETVEVAAAAAAAGFAFGWLSWLGILWWPVIIITLLIEGFWTTRRASDEEYGLAGFMVVVVLITLHLFGVIDLINLFKYQWREVLTWGLYYLAAGGAYMAIRGVLTLFKNKPKFAAEYEEQRLHWMDMKKREDKSSFNQKVAEKEWDSEHAQEIWNNIKSVERDKSKILAWIVFWPLDLLWNLVFQWMTRMADLWNLFWKGLRGIAQAFKDSILGKAPPSVGS